MAEVKLLFSFVQFNAATAHFTSIIQICPTFIKFVARPLICQTWYCACVTQKWQIQKRINEEFYS